MGPCEAPQTGATNILKSAVDPVTGMEIRKTLDLRPPDASLHLVQTMTNRGGKKTNYCLWDRTLCAGGGFALVPLNPRSRFKHGWSLLKKGAYQADEAVHPGVRVIDGVLVAKAEGGASKLGADSDAGWIAYARGRQLFVKFYPYFPDGKYSDGGNSAELYFDPKVCELEPLSPEVALKPGEEYAFPEKWILIPLEREVTTHEEARELARKIPVNPFRK